MNCTGESLMPTVSVIIPTYNRSKLVKEAIESVIGQDYTNFEILIIDDGSIDDTRSVIEQIPDRRVKYFYKDNGGQRSAQNFGITKAQGDFVAFLDSDDLCPKNHLAPMINSLIDNLEYSVAYSLVYILTSDGKKRNLTHEHRYKT